MKHFAYLLVLVSMVACVTNTRNASSSQNEKKQPDITYIYDGSKEICLYSDNIATVDGKSGTWYKSDKIFRHWDGASPLQTKTREYIRVDYGAESLIIWPGTGLVFFGMDNVNASYDNPSNERLGKRCYRKR